MIPKQDYGETITSKKLQTGSASIELTPEMFTLLSDGMYSDKILAAIREPICNARDAQIEAGEERALEVHLPNQLEPFFHVRDYGNGLSERQVLGYTEIVKEYDQELGELIDVEQHVAGLYLRYGKSTKRDTNLQIGGFGIGCKAPLAYSDSFLVESYQQGTVKIYSVYKENGIPNVAKLTEKLTTEPDGLKVKISVASHDINRFVNKVEEFAKFFDYPMDIVGATIESDVEYLLRTERYDIVKSYGTSVQASMGGVVYNVSDEFGDTLSGVSNHNKLIMKFEIGDLSVAGSRETLSEDEATQAKLKETAEVIKREFYEVIKEEVEDTKHTPYEAFTLLKGYGLVVNSHMTNYKWVAKSVAEDFVICGVAIEDFIKKYQDTKYHTVKYRYSGKCQYEISLLSLSELPSILTVDRMSGYLKTAKQLSYQNDKNYVVVDGGDLTTLHEYFGEGTLATDKVTELYPVYFPKGVSTGKVKVTKSGLFDTDFNDLTEIDEGMEGYYIPFDRYTCVIQDLPHSLIKFEAINTVILGLISAGHLKEDEVVYSRKAGMRAIKKTNLQPLTWDKLKELAKRCYEREDYTSFLRSLCAKGDPISDMNFSMKPLWDKVKTDYPAWNTKWERSTKGFGFLTDCRCVKDLEGSFEKDLKKLRDTLQGETTQIREDYSILTSLSSYARLSTEVIDDIIKFCCWKRKQKLVENSKQAA